MQTSQWECLDNKMDVRFEITFNLSDKMVELFHESLSDEFVGSDRPITQASARQYLIKILKNREDLDLLGFINIFKGNQMVGFSLPRKCDSEKDKEMFNLSDDDYFKIGHFYIGKDYRGQGIGKEFAQQFKNKFNRMVYVVDPRNKPSIAVARSIGLKWAYDFYRVDKTWALYPEDLEPTQFMLFKN